LITLTIQNKILSEICYRKVSRRKAKEAADFIFKLQDKIIFLLAGEHEENYNKETLEYMLEH
jgi:hypothetical protein